MKVLILAPYPPHQAPNQRFRFEQYLHILRENHVEYDYHPFWSDRVWRIFYEPGHFILKTRGLVGGIWRRFRLLTTLNQYDYVFVHRECLPIGPPVIEYLIARWYKKKIIYDFDDAIWIQNYSSANKGVRWLKFHRKVGPICRFSFKVSTGNRFLAEYARHYNPYTEIIPTTIDTNDHHNVIKEIRRTPPLVIGWTGTHSTLIQIRQVENELEQLQQQIDFSLHVICNEDPRFKKLKYEYIPWKQETEITDLLEFDIGIMPLRNTDWERGKCGFKALQYMALGIPVVASAVGANKDILTHELDSFLIDVNQPEDWISSLKKLLTSDSLRQQMGLAGRKTVEDKYSVNSNKEKYIRLFSDYREKIS